MRDHSRPNTARTGQIQGRAGVFVLLERRGLAGDGVVSAEREGERQSKQRIKISVKYLIIILKYQLSTDLH